MRRGVAPLWLRRAITLGHRLFETVATLAFGVMALLFAYTIIMRYGVGTPSRWSDELIVILFLWVVFGASALVVPVREHIAVGLVVDNLSPRLGRWLVALGGITAGLILLAALPVTLDYIGFLWRERTPAMRWPLSRVYLIFGLFQGMMGLRLILEALLPFVQPDPSQSSDPSQSTERPT
ncbi:TRAP transporter small permease [Pararhodobacter zhoushanensis]|uniref:TRAP transporter small permease n=1 Tax=Pararhodobacter zhoushanensis TaxID=2479545 RepID=UPI000F8F6D28|nr:TRAP transporter small permease subunit [Pararhodobacter zhoushanensis]